MKVAGMTMVSRKAVIGVSAILLISSFLSAAPPKRLNNLVSELAVSQPLSPGESLAFTNPRRGWIYVSAGAGKGDVWLVAGGKEDRLIVAKQEPAEAMRFLSAGDYQVKVKDGRRENVTVRAIPVIMFISYMKALPLPSNIDNHTNDWEFLRRYIHPHINTISICRGKYGMPTEEQFREWKEQSKRWIVEMPLPFIKKSPNDFGTKITQEDILEDFKKMVGLKDSRLSGVLLDEFVSKENNFPKNLAWIQAMDTLKQDPRYKDKEFYCYVNQPHHLNKDYRQLADFAVKYGCPVVTEVYPREIPMKGKTREEVFNSAWNAQMRENWKKFNPGMNDLVMIALGGLNLPWTNNDVDPGLNFKVWLDRYFQFVATDPSWDPLQGVGFWTSGYADEELLRWEARLFRHYAIEGRTDPLSTDPYELNHLENPDITQGTKGWDLRPAAADSIRVGFMNGYGCMTGFYRYPGGDCFLVTRRSKDKPNLIQQTIKNLTPGRRYTFRMYTGDLNEFKTGNSSESVHGVEIRIDGVEIEKRIQQPYLGKAPDKRHALEASQAEMPQGMDTAPMKTEGTPCWLNYHWVLFRAKGPEATLVVSDWKNDNEMGGPEGQELMINYFQVQPYFEPER